jgi:hypothetical protein
LQNQVEMVIHKAIRNEPEGITLLGLRQGVQKGLEVVAVVKDGVAMIATMEGVVHQTVTDQARLSSDAAELIGSATAWQQKNDLPPLLTPLLTLRAWYTRPSPIRPQVVVSKHERGRLQGIVVHCRSGGGAGFSLCRLYAPK